MNNELTIHCLDFNHIKDYTDVMRYCRDNGIRYMIYYIFWKRHLIKVGIQHKQGTGTDCGERLYTQAGWMPGWSKPCLMRGRKTGLATQKMIALAEQKYGGTFHKNDVVIVLEDWTHYQFKAGTKDTDNRYPEMQNAEEYAKDDFYNCFEYYPVGNPKQEPIRTFVSQNLFEEFFK
jgi:hypothetical protein